LERIGDPQISPTRPKKAFIRPFFATVQLVMAGNDTEGLRYGVIETPEKYYLTWKEASKIQNPLDRAVSQLCRKDRLLEITHDFIVFNAGAKKTCRHNQYFGVRAAQDSVKRREGGIIWHTQGSGKRLTMVAIGFWMKSLSFSPTTRLSPPRNFKSGSSPYIRIEPQR